MRNLIVILLQLYVVCLIVRLVLSWFPLRSGGFMATVNEFLFAITEPILAPLRRAIPMLRFGAMGIDLSPLIVLIVLQIVVSALQ